MANEHELINFHIAKDQYLQSYIFHIFLKKSNVTNVSNRKSWLTLVKYVRR